MLMKFFIHVTQYQGWDNPSTLGGQAQIPMSWQLIFI
jgi:hypothetical protein